MATRKKNPKEAKDPNRKLTEQELYLPIHNIDKIIRKNLPSGAIISMESKKFAQEIASEFIGFVTDQAKDISSGQNRKTISGNDIYDSMERLGFNKYLDPVKKHFAQRDAMEAQRKAKASPGFRSTASMSFGSSASSSVNTSPWKYSSEASSSSSGFFNDSVMKQLRKKK